MTETELRIVDGPTPGPHRAVPSTPPRAPRSARRTTSIDATRPDGLRGRLVVDVRGQDVVTNAAGAATVVDRVHVVVEMADPWGAITSVTAHADGRALDDLVGVPIRGGYGRRLAEMLPDKAERRTLLYSAIEDLSAGVLVSGYSVLHAGLVDESYGTGEERAAHQADICIGWATGNPLVEHLRHTGVTACPMGPAAPTIEGDDPHGWHPMEPLGTYTVRRRRRLDVHATDDGLVVDSHFRDSCNRPDGEHIMHEYLVDTRIADDRVAAVTVDPRVLPWHECPGAVASAQGVVGVPVDDIAVRARRELVGPSTCTHLTSTLRCLADVTALTGLLP